MIRSDFAHPGANIRTDHENGQTGQLSQAYLDGSGMTLGSRFVHPAWMIVVAGAAEPGGDRAVGDAERLGHLLVAELAQRHQQEDVTFTGSEQGEGPGKLWLQALRGHRGQDAALRTVSGWLGGRPGQRPVVAGLLAPVPGHEVGGDAVQPGPQAAASGVEPVPLAERDKERLGRDVVGHLRVQPPGHIPVDVADVPVVDDGEQLRIPVQPAGQLGVRDRPAHTGGQAPCFRHTGALPGAMALSHPCFAESPDCVPANPGRGVAGPPPRGCRHPARVGMPALS